MCLGLLCLPSTDTSTHSKVVYEASFEAFIAVIVQSVVLWV